MISFDLETHLIRPGVLAPPIVCGSAAGGRGGPVLMLKDKALEYIEYLLRAGETIAGANIAYDFGCVAAAKPELLLLIFDAYEEGRIFDVHIACMLDLIAKGCVQEGELLDPRTGAKLKDPAKGTITNRVSLAACVDLYLGRKDAKANDEWRLRYAELDGLPLEQWPEVARQYPIDDAVNTLEVAQVLQARGENLINLAPQCAAAWAAHLSAMWGMRTNPARVEAMRVALESKRAEDVAFAKSKGFMREDGTKDTKLLKSHVALAYLGEPPMTETGAVSTAREVLEESGDEALERFSEVSKTEKLLKTYLPFVEEGTRAPINVKPNILLSTGRASYEGLIQLLPRKGPTRECFEPRPGKVWCSVDYSAIELSTLAQVCLWTVGRSKLAEVINDGKDPHCIMAAQLGAVSYEEALAGKESGHLKDLRQAGKAANFGFPGGMGAAKFVLAKRKENMRVCQVMRTAEVCGVEKVTQWKGRPCPPVCRACCEAAEKLRSFYLSTWVEMQAYFSHINAHLQDTDRVTQFVSQRVRGGVRFTQACNTLFQGLAADGAKLALWEITKEAYLDSESPLYGSRVIVFAHDELILEMPEEQAHEAASRQTEVMIDAMRVFVPDVRVSAEPALMRRWYKDAKPVYEGNRLVPWEPEEKAA